jgi:hypothetical protein
MKGSEPSTLIRAAGPPGPVESFGPEPRELMPLCSEVDGFQRALDLEQRALRDALAGTRHGIQEQLTPLVADLYAVLRSPIYPKRSYLSLADTLLKTVESGKKQITLYGVLASPTAVTEAHSILYCATLFKRYGFTPRLKMFLARWENLVEIPGQSTASGARTFAYQVRAVTEIARQAQFADAVIPIDIQVESEHGEILNPPDVQDWSRRVLSAATDPRGADLTLTKDVAWCAGFYARQSSLSWLGEPQALFDLAIRRAIGRRISAEHASHAHIEDQVTAMVTLELHKRFLACYDASVPIINLDGRACARIASASAVA